MIVSHFEIAGNTNKDLQQSNIRSISLTFWVFQFEITGNNTKFKKLKNNQYKFNKLSVFPFDILDKDSRDLQNPNIIFDVIILFNNQC